MIELTQILELNQSWKAVQVGKTRFNFPIGLNSYDEDSFVFFSETFLKKQIQFDSLKWAGCFISEEAFKGNQFDKLTNKTVVIVPDAKLAYAQLYQSVKPKETSFEKNGFISNSSTVANSAQISMGSFIGPNCRVGENSVIGPNAVLVSNVSIGSNVTVGACSVIGGSGFGYVRDEDNNLVDFPQIGGVVVSDYVEIGSNTSIDSGALDPTVIGAHSKIDNLVHIAHNVVLGERTLVIAGAVICGSVNVGRDCWIAPGAIIREHLTIGDSVFIGMGSIVTKSLESRSRVFGNPARNIPLN